MAFLQGKFPRSRDKKTSTGGVKPRTFEFRHPPERAPEYLPGAPPGSTERRQGGCSSRPVHHSRPARSSTVVSTGFSYSSFSSASSSERQTHAHASWMSRRASAPSIQVGPRSAQRWWLLVVLKGRRSPDATHATTRPAPSTGSVPCGTLGERLLRRGAANPILLRHV